jgi:hypothetical protein
LLHTLLIKERPRTETDNFKLTVLGDMSQKQQNASSDRRKRATHDLSTLFII